MSQVEFRVATEFNVVKVRVSKSGLERIERLAGKCLGCEAPIVKGDRVSCGLCNTCYHGALHAIRKRRVTRKELIAEGKMLAPAKGGRRPANKFTQELLDR